MQKIKLDIRPRQQKLAKLETSPCASYFLSSVACSHSGSVGASTDFWSPGWAVTSTHDKLYGILFYLGLWSPAAAIIFAGLVYDRNRRRGSLAAYLIISLLCAVVGYALGAALGIASACSSQSAGNLCPIIGIIAVGPFVSALAIVFVAGLWRKARSWPCSVCSPE